MESPIRNDEVKSIGLVQVLTPEQTEEQSRAREAEPQTDPVVVQLAGHIRKCFTAADTAKRAGKKPIQTRLLQCSRQRDGEYDPEKQALIDKQGGTNIYMMLTDIKCRAAESWLKDIMLPSGERPFAIQSTPIPELPPDVVEGIYAGVQKFFQQNIASGRINPDDVGQLGPKAVEKMRADLLKEIKKEGKKAAEQMTVEVNDQLTEGSWYQALSDVIEDVCSFPTAFMEGPIVRKKKVLEWHETSDGVGYTPIPVEKIVREYERFSPFDAFPSPGARSVQDGYFIRRLFYRRSDLSGMIGVEGFDETAVRNVLERYGDGGLREWLSEDNERSELEGKTNEDQDPEGKIECHKFWGNVQGSMLREWGMTEQEVPDPDIDYAVVAYAIGEYVISARINPHPLGGRKLFSTSFKKKNDSIWGKCPPEMMRDINDICNSCARAIINNMAIGSGPQVWMIRDRMPIGQDAEDMYPWKIWPFESDKVKGRADVPMGFFQPTVVTEKLLSLYQYFFEQASEVTGIPAYIYGSDKIGGAGKALANYEEIVVPDGLKKISEMMIGDMVCSTDSSTAVVRGVFPQGKRKIYRVHFSNKTSVDCDLSHRWSVRDHHDRKFRTLTLRKILKKGLTRKQPKGYRCPSGKRPKWMLPKISPVAFDYSPVPIDPYTMGALIGDGDARCRLTSEDAEIFNNIPYELGVIDKKRGENAYARTIKGIKKKYHALGLNCTSLEKFIPEIYLNNSIEVRCELLKGLMDTDGCASKEGQVFFATSSPRLAKDFKRLVLSLGGAAKKICRGDGGDFMFRGRKCTRKDTFRITFTLPMFDVFSLKRKQSRITKRDVNHVFITDVEFVGEHDATCITVDSPDHLFLCSNFAPTHNTASGLSMLMGAASKGLRSVAKNIDDGIIAPSVKEHWLHIMVNEPEKARGDVKIVARASEYLIQQEQISLRRNEFLQTTANPVDAAIMGNEGRAYLLRERAKDLKLDTDKIVPDDETIAQNDANAKIQEIMMALSKELKIPVENLMSIAMGQGGGGMVPGKKPTNLDAAGNPLQGKATQTVGNRG